MAALDVPQSRLVDFGYTVHSEQNQSFGKIPFINVDDRMGGSSVIPLECVAY